MKRDKVFLIILLWLAVMVGCSSLISATLRGVIVHGW